MSSLSEVVLLDFETESTPVMLYVTVGTMKVSPGACGVDVPVLSPWSVPPGTSSLNGLFFRSA